MSVIKPEYIQQEVNIHDLLPLPFLNLSAYTGSKRKMRYRIEKELVSVPSVDSGEVSEEKKEKILRAAVWFTPNAFDKTEDADKKYSDFAFSDQGIADIIDWLNAELKAYEEGR